MLGFSDTVWFRVEGWPNRTLQRLYWPLMLKPSLPGGTLLFLSPHNVELSSIQVLGENQDLARETLSPWWEHVLIYGIIPYYGRSKTLKCVVLKILLNFNRDQSLFKNQSTNVLDV